MSVRKKSVARILFFTCLCILFFMTYLYAAGTTQRAGDINKAKIEKKPVLVKPLPDLIVKDISLDMNCAIKFTIMNIGMGGVPDEAYQNPDKGFLKMYDGTKFLGGLGLSDIDSAKKLKNKGGSVSPTSFPGNYNRSGSHSIKIVVDDINSVKEGNENNNELTKALTCSPLQIKQMSIGSDAAGNCYVHIFLNKDANKNLPLAASKISLSNRSFWNKIEWGNAQGVFLTSYPHDNINSTCFNYPCTIHVSIDQTFVKDPAGGALDGDYDGIPGGNFVQNIVVQNAGSWGEFHHY